MIRHEGISWPHPAAQPRCDRPQWLQPWRSPWAFRPGGL